MAFRRYGQDKDLAPLRPGWSSFFGAPLCPDPRDLQADVAFLGVPFDLGTNDRPGSRFGPAAIREASMRLQGHDKQGWVDPERGVTILEGVGFADCGDVDIRVLDSETNFKRITQAVRSILKAGAFPALVGGDHTISYPAARAFGDRRLTVVHFDAHLDFTDEWKGVRLSHDNPMRRIVELPFVAGLVQIGIRELVNRPAIYRQAMEYGSFIVPALELHRKGAAAALARAPSLGPCYVTIDIDVLDPAVAPGTGFPEPGGLTYYELKDALLEIVARGEVLGFDLVEVTPVFDPSGRTARTAARLILDLLGAVMASRAKNQPSSASLERKYP